jgi:2'-5' RNA ligase
MKDTIRTFVAVEIDAAVRQRAGELIEQLRGSGADVKWVEVENLHLTLKFLGEVRSREIPQVCEAVERAAAGAERFELELSGAGAFPNVRRPRTVWLGAGKGSEEMVLLHKEVEAALGKLGFRPEQRRFQPHLTIGRVRRGGPAVAELGQLIEQRADFFAGRADVQQVVVFSSQLDRSGPTYEALSRARLGGK